MGHAKSWDNLFKPQTKRLHKYRRLKTYYDRSSDNAYFRSEDVIKMLEDRPTVHNIDLKKQMVKAIERVKKANKY